MSFTPDPRAAAMNYHQVLYCPIWCAQPDDEHDYDRHIGNEVEYTTAEGQELVIRFELSWWQDDGGPVLIIRTAPDENDEITLTVMDWQMISGHVEILLAAVESPDYRWAFDGAAAIVDSQPTIAEG